MPAPNKTASTILVVDDSPTNVMLLESLLTADGYVVRTAGDGPHALESVAAKAPDLILLDIRMAGLDGFEVFRRLKAQHGTRDIPIMFISAVAEGAERVEGLRMGAVDFVSKPIQREELRARVRTHLELRRLRLESEWQAAELKLANLRLRGELAEKQKIEKALERSLHEKEDMLKEVHHRVKNNLALIISLMRIEASRSGTPETKGVLKEMQARIRSVVLLNEALYKTESYSRVRLADYLGAIATHLFEAQVAKAGSVKLAIALEPVGVATAQAIPCGLIVNELLTNSLKHAFTGGRSGEIRIRLDRDAASMVRLRISDTGVGLPADFAQRRTKSLGLQLVSDLARQIGGTFVIEEGAIFTIAFPSPASGETAAIPRPR